MVSDNSGSVTLTSNYQSGDAFPIGNTDVVFTATDLNGNTATAILKLTVQGLCFIHCSVCNTSNVLFFFDCVLLALPF